MPTSTIQFNSPKNVDSLDPKPTRSPWGSVCIISISSVAWKVETKVNRKVCENKYNKYV